MEYKNEDNNRESEQLKEEPEIKEALEESRKSSELHTVNDISKEPQSRGSIWIMITILFISAAVYLLIRLNAFSIEYTHLPLMQNIAAGISLSIGLLILNQLIRRFLKRKVGNHSTRYNLRRITDLVVVLIITFIAISVISSNWYTVIVSLGLISLILGLALQNWLTSFFGWVYILIRKPYKVGDRIKIGHVTGDVIALSYFDTTLWEFRGDYLSSDHPSGRIIRFGNNRVFNEYIINFSWPLFPYIWNELNIFVSYDSDFLFISDNIKKIIHEDMGAQMEKRIELYRNILQETPVDELEVRSGASVSFRANNNGWIEVVVRYLVEPKQSGRVKGRLFKKIMEALKNPVGKVRFPNTK